MSKVLCYGKRKHFTMTRCDCCGRVFENYRIARINGCDICFDCFSGKCHGHNGKKGKGGYD